MKYIIFNKLRIIASNLFNHLIKTRNSEKISSLSYYLLEYGVTFFTHEFIFRRAFTIKNNSS